jgi:hypothetical protein
MGVFPRVILAVREAAGVDVFVAAVGGFLAVAD